MKFSTTLLICIFGAMCVSSAPAMDTSRMSEALLRHVQRQVEGCNANICFAMDGSDTISESEFNIQKSFILDVVTITGDMASSTNPIQFAGVQYASSLSVMSRLTSDLPRFFLAVEETMQMGGGTSLARGIGFCIRELRRRSGGANKIVVLGAGGNKMGARAVRSANRFRSMGGEVCVVGVGFPDSAELLALAGGDPTQVFEVSSFIDIVGIQFIIEDLVADICGLPASN